MPTYTAALEALDVKRGHVHTVADWHRIRDKAEHAPASLSDDDLVVLEGFGGPKDAVAARAHRDQARHPAPVKAATTPAPRTSPAAPARPITAVIAEMVTPMVAKQKALEQRIAALESRPLLKYAGIHVEGQPYAEAQLVTRSGSLWVSTEPTSTTPGTPGSHWRLIVKRGSA
jgi:hypothetical protein